MESIVQAEGEAESATDGGPWLGVWLVVVRHWRSGQEAVVDHGGKMTEPSQFKEMRRLGKEAVRAKVVRVEALRVDPAPDTDD